MLGNDPQSDQKTRSTAPGAGVERRKVRAYWIGLCVYLFIFLNAVRLVGQVPYEVVVAGALLNAAIIVGTFLLLRRAYRKLRNETSLK